MITSQQYTSVQGAMATDPKGLGALRRLNGRDEKAGAQAVAKQFEALLMQQMINSMRQASQVFGEDSSGAAGLFRSMQDQQWAQVTGTQGGLGLTDAILRQIEQQAGASISSSQQALNAVQGLGRGVLPNEAAKPAAGSASDADGFLNRIGKVAERAAEKLGVSAQLVLAHAALETGWGKRTIQSANGQDSHNLFGIKAGRNWDGKTTDVMTTEVVDGMAQKRVERFRVYDSYADAFADYAKLLQQRFSAALGQGNDAKAFGQALQSGGYATDPAYANKIAQVARNVNQRLAAHQTGSSPRA